VVPYPHRKIPGPYLVKGQAVREYRKALIHEEDEEADAVPFAVASEPLLKCLSYLPPDW